MSANEANGWEQQCCQERECQCKCVDIWGKYHDADRCNHTVNGVISVESKSKTTQFRSASITGHAHIHIMHWERQQESKICSTQPYSVKLNVSAWPDGPRPNPQPAKMRQLCHVNRALPPASRYRQHSSQLYFVTVTAPRIFVNQIRTAPNLPDVSYQFLWHFMYSFPIPSL